jgi:hypothetical protein
MLHQSSEEAFKKAVREYISQLRQGLWGFKILLSELAKHDNWSKPLSHASNQKKFSITEMKTAYEKRIEQLTIEGRPSSRQKDDAWAKANGFPITMIRQFRNDLAPNSWRTKGRRPVKE